MAIRIPSKNIYNIETQKVRNNVIQTASVEQVVVSPNNEYEIPIYNKVIPLNWNTENNSGGENDIDRADFEGYPAVAVGTISYNRYADIEITINKIENNKLISKIYNSVREGSKTSYTQISKKYQENVLYYQVQDAYQYDYENYAYDSHFDFEKIKSYSSSKTTLSTKTMGDIAKVNIHFEANDENGEYYEERFVESWKTPELLTPTQFDINASISGLIYGGNLTAGIPTNFSVDEEKLSDLEITDNGESFTIKIPKVFVGRTMYAVATAIYTYNPTQYNGLYPAKVVEIQQNVVRGEITIYGDTIGISLENGNISYIKNSNGETVEGSGNNPYTLGGNELLQSGGTVNGEPITKHLASNVLREYSNGKETVSILCSIDKYYDKNGNLVIDPSTNNAVFKVGDIVIPMDYINGKEVPLSKYKDGSEKSFMVVAVRYKDSGVVYQKLQLLEKSQNLS